jgi:hypothetical protein
MSGAAEEARKRARHIRDEALARHAERDRICLATLRSELAELKVMVAGQQEQLARLTAMIAELTARPVPPALIPIAPPRPRAPSPPENASPWSASGTCAPGPFFCPHCRNFPGRGRSDPVRPGTVVQRHPVEPLEESRAPVGHGSGVKDWFALDRWARLHGVLFFAYLIKCPHFQKHSSSPVLDGCSERYDARFIQTDQRETP